MRASFSIASIGKPITIPHSTPQVFEGDFSFLDELSDGLSDIIRKLLPSDQLFTYQTDFFRSPLGQACFLNVGFGSGKTWSCLLFAALQALVTKKNFPDQRSSEAFKDWKPTLRSLLIVPTASLADSLAQRAKDLSCDLERLCIA